MDTAKLAKPLKQAPTHLNELSMLHLDAYRLSESIEVLTRCKDELYEDIAAGNFQDLSEEAQERILDSYERGVRIVQKKRSDLKRLHKRIDDKKFKLFN